MDKDDLQEMAKANRDKKRQEREDELRKVTTEDNVLGLAGSMLGSNRAALKALDTAIDTIDSHVKQIESLKKRERDNFTRAMYVFDDVVADYSSEQWDEEQVVHQENLDALIGLRDAMKKEVEEGSGTESGSDNHPSDLRGGEPDSPGRVHPEGEEAGERHDESSGSSNEDEGRDH